MHRFFVVWAMWLGALTVSAQVGAGTGKMEFQHLNEGLSQNRVTAILQDHEGYIWIGTYAGLNRYDGVGFEIFENVRGDSTSLPDSYIFSLYEDADRNLWVGTASGLARYDRVLHRFVRYGSRYTQNDDPDAQVINTLGEDQEGRLLIGSTGGLFRLLETGDIVRVEGQFQNQSIRALLTTRDDVWVGSSNGLDRLTAQDKVVPVTDAEGYPIPFGRVTDLASKGPEEFWVATQGGGAFRLLGEGPDFQWKRFQYDPEDPASIGNDRVQALLVDGKETLWVGTENGGLSRYDSNTEDFSHYTNDPDDPSSLNSNSIWELTEDQQGRLWLGTFNQGAEIWDPYYRKFQTTKAGLSHNVVSALIDFEGELWIGTDGGGINRWDGDDITQMGSGDRSGLTSDAILAFHRDHLGQVWIGTWAGGLLRYEPASETFEQWTTGEDDFSTLPSPNIFGIDEDREGNLWVAALDGGVSRWDRSDNQFFTISSAGGTRLTSDVLISLTVDRQDIIWAGTESGLNRIDFRSELDYEVQQFTKDAEDPEALQSNVINQIYEDQEGSIWVATGAGLSLYNSADGTFQTYDKLSGLPNSVIKGVVEDANGNLWVSTNDGVSKMQQTASGPVFENYNVNDGLQGKEFSRGVMMRDVDGMIFMGGTNGFSFLDPTDINTNPHAPKVVLTDFKLFGKTVAIGTADSPLKQHISTLNEVTLKPSQNVFSIGFTGLNLTHASKNQYTYRLEGFDERWTDYNSNRSATYTNLEAGTYTFKVRASNNDGVSNDEGISLDIHVLPFWWETWWFRLALFASLLTGGAAIYRYRQSLLRAAHAGLEEKIRAATEEIELKSMELERQRDSLEAAVMDTDFVIREAVDSGNFSARVQVEGKQGEWKNLGTSINQLFDSVLVPLNTVKSLMKEIAQGNMTSRYTANAKGDILDLATNVNEAILSLAGLLRSVSDEVSNMTTVADQMSESSDDMTATTSEISKAIEEINAGASNQLSLIDEAHNLLNGIVSSADAMNQQAFNINESASQGTDLSAQGARLMDQLAESMQKVMSSSQKTTEATTTLSNRSVEISSIVRIMKEIAAQTNLLALNAAIEAAQAGDAGRGFAVVAEEIRKLAEDSKKSANEIETLIQSIQDDTGKTATLIGEMGVDIQSGEQTTKQAAVSFQDISDYYQKTFEASTSILNAAQQQSTDIETVVHLIQNLVTVAEQTAAGSEEVNTSTELMLSAMESVRDQSQVMLGALRDLEQQVNQFQLQESSEATV